MPMHLASRSVPLPWRAGLAVVSAATILIAACARPASLTTPTRLDTRPCASARRTVTEYLRRMAVADTATLGVLVTPYEAVADTMLVECGNEARGMSAQFADDWKIQAFFVRDDLERLRRMRPAEAASFLPAHRARVARLVATYDGMYSNPPQRR